VTRRSVAEDLKQTADRIGDADRADLQILIRSAALLLRNVEGVPLEPEWEDALRSVSADMKLTRSELVRTIVKDWLIANTYLPASTLEEDSEGAAFGRHLYGSPIARSETVTGGTGLMLTGPSTSPRRRLQSYLQAWSWWRSSQGIGDVEHHQTAMTALSQRICRTFSTLLGLQVRNPSHRLHVLYFRATGLSLRKSPGVSEARCLPHWAAGLSF